MIIVRLKIIFILAILALPVTVFPEPDTFSEGFSHLMSIATEDTCSVDINKTETLLNHVLSENYLEKPEYSGGLPGTSSAFQGFAINTSIKKLLQYCYNTKIPGCAIDPEGVRISRWTPSDSPVCTPNELWTFLPNPEKPRIKKGLLYLQNTPDPNTGAYYGYNSYKAGILFRHKGRNIFISVSKQKGRSEVGKKGFPIPDCGSDAFYYSGETGLNKFGFGSIKSYLYDAFGVIIYIEDTPGHIRGNIYKWLRGGCAGMNMIREKHIRKGIGLFIKRRKAFMESDNLPEFPALAAICTQCGILPENQLKDRMRSQLDGLNLICKNNDNCPELLRKGFDAEKCLSRMTTEEMRAEIVASEIKKLLNETRRKIKDISLTRHQEYEKEHQ